MKRKPVITPYQMAEYSMAVVFLSGAAAICMVAFFLFIELIQKISEVLF